MKKIEFPALREALYSETLDNGLQVFILPKEGFSKTYAVFTAKYGSIDSEFTPLGKSEKVKVPNGIAHFLEHKLFEKEDGDVFQTFSANGANINAFTSFTKTAYLFSATGRVEENLRTLLDFVQAPYFTEETVEKEKGIIEQEISMYDDMPDWRLYFGAIENLFANHPVRIDIAGTAESIAPITAEHLYECYHTFYHPSNMLLFVTGAVDPERVMELVRTNQAAKAFDAPASLDRSFPKEPERAAVADRSIFMDVQKPKVMIGIKAPRASGSGQEMQRRELAIDAALDLLFGRSSSFYQSLYEQGIVDETYSYEATLEDSFGFVLIACDTAEPEAFEEAVARRLGEVAAGWEPAEEELQRTVRKQIGSFLRSLNSIEFIANQFTHYAFYHMDMFATVQLLEGLKASEVAAAFRPFAERDRRTAFRVLPGDESCGKRS